MKERPVLFSATMVRAILDGRKTQTRRIIKPQPYIDEMGNFCWNGENFGQDFNGPCIQAIASPIPSSKTKRVRCPYGKPGDRLWVRETFNHDGEKYIYAADLNELGVQKWAAQWKPSIHMPRSASRILLEITGVRVERLQDISEEDAIAEGISRVPFRPCDGWPICDGYMVGKDDGVTGLAAKASTAYKKLWESINGPGSWDMNPFVWVVEFRRIN